jgi:hypothetical protein
VANVSRPVPGFYRRRLVKGGPAVGVLIFQACPIDPETGEPMQRSRPLLCLVNGEWADPIDEWEWIAGSRISEAEYLFLLADAAHAAEHRPTAPRARPREKINLLESELPF